MKERMSITLDKKTIEILNKLIEKRRYRNRSHAVEEIILSCEKEVKHGK